MNRHFPQASSLEFCVFTRLSHCLCKLLLESISLTEQFRCSAMHPMAIEQTLSIIKPDGVEKAVIGNIISRFETAGLRVVAARMESLSEQQAKDFYAEHSDRPFYAGLVEFMTSGPVLLMVLEGEGAIASNRRIMGATNPAEAEAGTIRADFATSIDNNTVHGSDSPASAAREIAFFFPEAA